MKAKLSYVFFITLLFSVVTPKAIQSQIISGNWTIASSENFTARVGSTASAVNGKIFVIGGNMHATYWDDLKVYDPLSDTWADASMVGTYTPRSNHTASVVNGNIYIIGGYFYNNNVFNIVKPVEMFDPLAGTWTTVNTTGSFTARRFLCDAVIGEKIFIFGGDTLPSASRYHFPDNYVEVLDLSTNIWSTVITSGTFTPRALATANVVNGKVYIIGGKNSDSVLNSVDIFDPATNSWTQPTVTGNFEPRSAHCSGLIDGKIFIAAGAEIKNIENIDVYDLAKNAWESPLISGVFSPRFAAFSCVIDNKLYVIGGYDDNITPLNVNEVLTIDKASVLPKDYSSSIHILPNPTKKYLNVEIIGARPRMTSVLIFDNAGKSVKSIRAATFSEGIVKVDISLLPTGAYTAAISSELFSVYKNFLVVR